MNYLDETVDSLNQELVNGEISVQGLADRTIANIKKTDKKVNTFTTIDEGVKASENLDFVNKLAGISIAIKDNIITNGLKTTATDHTLDNSVSTYDAIVMSKPKKAGVTVAGKANLDEFAMGSNNENSYSGTVHNSWNLDKMPDSSSGGSVAAVVGGEIVAALGSDIDGSIHQSTAFSGIFGIKPTYGRVLCWGLVAFASSLDQIDVLAKRAQDAAEILNAINGADEHDSTVSEKAVPDSTKTLDRDVKGLRVVVPRECISDVVDESIRRAIQEQIDSLEENGAIISGVSLPHTRYVVSTYYIIASSEASSNLQRYDGIRYGYRARDTKNLFDVYVKSRPEGFGGEVKRWVILGSSTLSAGPYDKFFRQASKVRTLICRDFGKIFEDNDVIVGPTTTGPVFGIGSEVKGPIKIYGNDILTISANMPGVPTASVPAGLVDGVPVGLWIVAKRSDEESILRVADFIERNNKFCGKKPAGLED